MSEHSDISGVSSNASPPSFENITKEQSTNASSHSDQNYDDENASLSSEDSNEPYYHVQTGRVLHAREAWGILAKEGHERFRRKLGMGKSEKQNVDPSDAIFQSRRATESSAEETASSATSQSLASGRILSPGKGKEGEGVSLSSGGISDGQTNITTNTAAQQLVGSAVHEAAQTVAQRTLESQHMGSTEEFSISVESEQEIQPSASNVSQQSPDGVENSDVDDIPSVSAASSFGPTQSSIDKALHPDGLSISPHTQKPFLDKNQRSHSGLSHSNLSQEFPDPGIADNNDGEDEEEEDPIILRAKAMAMMALAAQEGQKLTPEQMHLIAQPDVQQQKLIVEAIRSQKAKEREKAIREKQKKEKMSVKDKLKGGVSFKSKDKKAENPLQKIGADFQRMGEDWKKFIEVEKEKNPMQWGADLGKFIEEQSMKMAHENDDEHEDENGGEDGEKREGDENEDERDAETNQGEEDAKPLKKKMEGFGTDPFAPSPAGSPRSTSKSLLESMKSLPTLPGIPTIPNMPGTSKKEKMEKPERASESIPDSVLDTPGALTEGKANVSSNVASSVTPSTPGRSSIWTSMPPLPNLNSSIFGGTGLSDFSPEADDKVVLSAILWKRRSGMGKHSSKAWERRRVELKGTRLMYYKTSEEMEEEKKENIAEAGVDVATSREAVIESDGGISHEGSSTMDASPVDSSNAPSADAAASTTTSDAATSSASLPTLPPLLPSNTSTKKLNIFEQAAQAAEQKLQTVKDDLSRMASAAGLPDSLNSSLNPRSSIKTVNKVRIEDIPRGVLDIVKEKATVGASIGHSGAPTPFCISIKVKSETKWKFCFESHAKMMEWLAVMTDLVVKASLAAHIANGGSGGDDESDVTWEMEDYCIRRKEMNDSDNAEGKRDSGKGASATIGESIVAPSFSAKEMSQINATIAEVGHEDTGTDGTIVSKAKPLSAEFKSSFEGLNKGEFPWSIHGTNLKIAWGLTNAALILVRSSSTSIDQYWMIVVLINFIFWQLCKPLQSRSSRVTFSGQSRRDIGFAGPSDTGSVGGAPSLIEESTDILKPDSAAVSSDIKLASKPLKLQKPVAGRTTLLVTDPADLNLNSKGFQFPTWTTVSSTQMEVRSHGYLSTKKKIPSPGELYECVAVDCFASDRRIGEIATKVVLPKVLFDEELSDGNVKTWKSPDLFVVSIAIPTEAPKIGRSTDDGPGTTIVAYFQMKKETRDILRRITSPGYEPANDTANSESDSDVQQRITNGVRLFEQWCTVAPQDPSFQARFKLIPSANLVELGCPSYIAKYNGKPVLIKRNQVTGFLSCHPQLPSHGDSVDVMEFDVSLHPFPFLFKQAMAYLKDNYFDKVVGTFGFVIEGRNDEELPEVVIGATRVCYPNPEYAVKGEEFLAGTCIKSCGVEVDEDDVKKEIEDKTKGNST